MIFWLVQGTDFDELFVVEDMLRASLHVCACMCARMRVGVAWDTQSPLVACIEREQAGSSHMQVTRSELLAAVGGPAATSLVPGSTLRW